MMAILASVNGILLSHRHEFSRWKWKVLSRIWPFATHSPWNSPGENTGVGSLSLFQGIFPNQGSNPGLPHCRWIRYQLSHKGSPRILGWVAYPIFRGSSQPRNWTRVSCLAGGFFTNWAIREALIFIVNKSITFPYQALHCHFLVQTRRNMEMNINTAC